MEFLTIVFAALAVAAILVAWYILRGRGTKIMMAGGAILVVGILVLGNLYFSMKLTKALNDGDSDAAENFAKKAKWTSFAGFASLILALGLTAGYKFKMDGGVGGLKKKIASARATGVGFLSSS